MGPSILVIVCKSVRRCIVFFGFAEVALLTALTGDIEHAEQVDLLLALFLGSTAISVQPSIVKNLIGLVQFFGGSIFILSQALPRRLQVLLVDGLTMLRLDPH